MISSSKFSTVFIHVPKTAGTTLRHIIENTFSDEQICLIYHGNDLYIGVDDFQNLSDEKKREYKIFMGHFSFGLHKLMPQQCQYITVLRNPIDRTISLFNHHTQEKNAQNDQNVAKVYRQIKSRNFTLSDFVESGLSHNNTDNGQTRLISGQMPKFKCCTTEMLIKAKNNLSEYFTVCGLTEKFDESYLLVQKALNLPFIFYTNKNITSSNKKNLKISESEIETITKHNELDLELYDYATHLLDEQINKLGSAFQDELDEFKLGNHKYQQKMKKIQFVSNLPSRAFNFIRSF